MLHPHDEVEECVQHGHDAAGNRRPPVPLTEGPPCVLIVDVAKAEDADTAERARRSKSVWLEAEGAWSGGHAQHMKKVWRHAQNHELHSFSVEEDEAEVLGKGRPETVDPAPPAGTSSTAGHLTKVGGRARARGEGRDNGPLEEGHGSGGLRLAL